MWYGKTYNINIYITLTNIKNPTSFLDSFGL